MRAALYMRTLSATRCNPIIRDFYQRLLASGKPKKVALVACMRKLLVTLNSMLKHRSPWCGVTPAVVCHSRLTSNTVAIGVEGAPESDCLLRCGRLAHSP